MRGLAECERRERNRAEGNQSKRERKQSKREREEKSFDEAQFIALQAEETEFLRTQFLQN